MNVSRGTPRPYTYSGTDAPVAMPTITCLPAEAATSTAWSSAAHDHWSSPVSSWFHFRRTRAPVTTPSARTSAASGCPRSLVTNTPLACSPGTTAGVPPLGVVVLVARPVEVGLVGRVLGEVDVDGTAWWLVEPC